MSDCIFVNFEDYNKLCQFKKGSVSAFAEDLLQFMTLGLVSPTAVEQFLGHLRDGPMSNDFSSVTSCASLQEFLIKKKMDQLKKPWLKTEPDVPLSVITQPAIKEREFDFSKQIHVIS